VAGLGYREFEIDKGKVGTGKRRGEEGKELEKRKGRL